MNPDTPQPTPFLQQRLVRLFTYGLLPLLALATMLLHLWFAPKPVLMSSDTRFECYSRLGLYFGIGFTLLALITGAITLFKRHSPKGLTALISGFTLLGFVSYLLSEPVVNSLFDNDLLWELPYLAFALVSFGLLSTFIATIWQLVARPLKQSYSVVNDAILTLLGMITIFFGGPLCAFFFAESGIENPFFWLTGSVCYCVILLAGALHLIWLIGSRLLNKIALNKGYVWCWALLVTLVFPLSGLFLNRRLPFPSDLQSPWCYGLTVLTAASLLMPDGKGRWGQLLAYFRWATFPFTLYFFILFLPFLPLSLPSMLILGAGILIFAPTLLMCFHVTALKRSAKAFQRTWTRWCVALLGLALIPSILVITVERERTLVRPLIAAIATPDTTTSVDTLPIPEAEAKRIAERLLSHNYASQNFPIISHWAEYRLFDGLHPRTEVLKSLAIRLNLTFKSRFNRSLWSNIRSASAPVTTELRGVGTCALTLSLTIPALEKAEEFRAPIRLADGVWITGLRLKMPNDGPWRDGLLCDRRAATWVYERLTERNIDPALLTLDTLTEGTLRVSPVTEPRHVEIDLLLPNPTWCNAPITIGDQTVRLPNGEAVAESPTPGATVCFIGPGAQHPLPKANLYVVATPVITVSESEPTELPTFGRVDAARAIRFAYGNAYAKNLCLTEAVYVGDGWKDATFTPMRPKRPLPTLAPDEPWQQGAIAAQLSEARLHAPHPEYNQPLWDAMQRSQALMPQFAYIVVETDEQVKALKTLDVIAKQAMEGVDFEEPNIKQSAPTFLLLLLAVLPLLVWQRRRA